MPSILMLTALLLSREEEGRGGGGLIKNIKLQMDGCLLESGGGGGIIRAFTLLFKVKMKLY